MQDKPHVSISQLGTLSRCGMQYFFRYCEGLKIPPGIAMVKGIAVHRAAALNGHQKIESHEDLPTKDLKEVAADAFEEQLRGDGIWLNPAERNGNADSILGEALDETVSMAGFYAGNIAPDYQPTHVEKSFTVSLPGTHDFLGIIDLIDDKRRVVDYKTSGKSKSQSEADNSLQLTAYASGHKLITGEMPDEVRLDVLVLTKQMKRQVLASTRGVDDFVVLAARVNQAIAVIQSGSFLPADPTHWCCSPNWCGYWDRCPYSLAHRRSK